jgi:hypothetical protein
MSYICSTCGETHENLPDIGSDRPDYWWGVAESERDDRIQLTEDTCIIDDNHFFIRGVIEIPILGENNRFGFGVWVSQKKENFYKYLENPESGEIGPFFGWLSTNIHFYSPTTISLKTTAHFRGNGLRPAIEVEPTEHPLAIDQHNGISLEKAWKIVHFYENLN